MFVLSNKLSFQMITETTINPSFHLTSTRHLYVRDLLLLYCSYRDSWANNIIHHTPVFIFSIPTLYNKSQDTPANIPGGAALLQYTSPKINIILLQANNIILNAYYQHALLNVSFMMMTPLYFKSCTTSMISIRLAFSLHILYEISIG